MRTISVWARYLRRFIGRVWYLPFIAALAGLDLFVLVVPTDFLIISYVLLRPKRWLAAMLWVSIGSACGALLLAAMIQGGGESLLHTWFPSLFASDKWGTAAQYVRDHGAVALAVVSASFLPQQPGVVVAALSHMSLLKIFLAVLAGRVGKYALFTWCASHAPRLLTKFAIGREAMNAIKKT